MQAKCVLVRAIKSKRKIKDAFKKNEPCVCLRNAGKAGEASFLGLFFSSVSNISLSNGISKGFGTKLFLSGKT